MRNHAIQFTLAALLAGSVPACSLDVGDENNPSLDDLLNHPTRVSIGAGSTGLLIGNRRNHAAENGYVAQLGILGREAYNFDGADPRYVSELLVGKLNAGSPFGGNFWPLAYNNIRLAVVVLEAVEKVDLVSDQEKSSIRGFAKTIEALDLLEVVATHDTNGAVIDLSADPLSPPNPLVSAPDTYARIIALLEDGLTDLTAAGDAAFPFELSSGFNGFNTPATFIKFNRAIRARVAAYIKDYPGVLTALAASFLDDTSMNINVNTGVYYSYSTKPGDTSNQLINPNFYAHPQIEENVQMNGPDRDARFVAKTALATTAGARGTTLNFKGLYSGPESAVPLIRNEELILLKSEALFFTGNAAGAIDELNIVRTVSGHLQPLPAVDPPPAPQPDEMTFVNELMYERTYSLLFEGHRWIDARRLNRLDLLPIYETPEDDGTKTPDTLNVRFPLPLPECDARPGEPRCKLGSTDS